jgi:hypothetical protein
MKDVFERLATDFLSTIVFLVIYLASGNIVLATSVAIAGAIGQVIYARIKGRELSFMTYASLALVIVLGTVTLLTRDPRRAVKTPDAHDRRDHAQARLDAALHAAAGGRDDPEYVTIAGYPAALMLCRLHHRGGGNR